MALHQDQLQQAPEEMQEEGTLSSFWVHVGVKHFFNTHTHIFVDIHACQIFPPVGCKVEKDYAKGHIGQVETQPVDVITAKTPEHKEPLVSPNHSTQHKREVFQTKG